MRSEKKRAAKSLRRAIEFARRADLDDRPPPHQRDTVGHAHRLLGIVGDEHCGGARLVQDAERLVAHLLAQPLVEAGKRLVHQHDARPRRHRAGERHALLLAAGSMCG